MRKHILFILFLLFSFQLSWSQNNPLNKKITIAVINQPVEKVLFLISKSEFINFSYNSDNLPLDSIVSLNVKQKSIYVVLNEMLSNKFYYKTAGQHIVILKKKDFNNTSTNTKKTKICIEGTIVENGLRFKTLLFMPHAFAVW